MPDPTNARRGLGTDADKQEKMEEEDDGGHMYRVSGGRGNIHICIGVHVPACLPTHVPTS